MIALIQKLAGTQDAERLSQLDAVYAGIEQQQAAWKNISAVSCPDGCGTCCVSFEPDVLEDEALYLAAWLMENDPQRAVKIRNGTYPLARTDNADGCFLFNPDSPYHCTVYGGRCLICRLFGFSGDHGKDDAIRWKPCRFLPAKLLAAHLPPLAHRQYSAAELKDIFGGFPPAMSDAMEQALSISPDSAGETRPLREALPEALRKLTFILKYAALSGSNDDDNFTPNDNGQSESA